jgi:alpha-amylase/alpha-mannosidase (GH57 family)
MKTALIIHGHFYQPPRENPWTEIVEREESARPFHDWNERIHKECYRPNGYAPIIDGYGRIELIVNNYVNMSFNFGPTLLSWLEREHKETYERILAADRESLAKRSGHGNAIAQSYNHTILPLHNERDRRTQVRWGLYDFRYRFGREAEAMWLPETACDRSTLETLIEEGLRYAILSPHQAERVRPLDGDSSEWLNVNDGSIDTTRPYKYLHRDGTGRSITLFFYDGPNAKAIAFDGALSSSQGLVDRFERAARAAAPEGCVNVATDGETYGHHFHWGDRTLAYALEVEAGMRGLSVTNYGEFLDHHPPEMEVEIRKGEDGQGTAWSCAHGLGRWSRDCGCQTGGREGWNQAWRAPLRKALDLLNDEAARGFEEGAGLLLIDPWAARDDYIELIANPAASRAGFLRRHAGRDLTTAEQRRALTFLEMQRSCMLMYTSCGWFFADISGIETQQVLRYAGRVMDLGDELGLPAVKNRFLEILSEARSNLAEHGNGADIFRRFVETARVTPARVAAHLAMTSLVDESMKEGVAASYNYRRLEFQKQEHGRLTLATEHLELESRHTSARYEYALSAMHFGDVDFYCVLKPFPGAQVFRQSSEKLWAQFRTASLPAILRLALLEFGPEEYGLEHLLPTGRERISELLFGQMVESFSQEYELLFKANSRNIEMLQAAGFELPGELRAAAEFTIGRRFEEEIRRHGESNDPAAYLKALEIANEVARRGLRIDRTSVRLSVEAMITRSVRFALSTRSAENFQAALVLVGLARKLNLEADLEQAQEAVYEALRRKSSTSTDTSTELRELASVLGLAPGLIERAGFKPASALVSVSSTEAAVK